MICALARRAIVGTLIALPAMQPALATNMNGAAQPAERIVWNRASIALALPVNQERMVTFPGDVRVGVPPALAEALRTQTVDGTVYWLARKPFPATRIQVQEIASGRIYLLDLRAESEASTARVEILVPRSRSEDTDGSTQPKADVERFDYVSLTRYAAQQMYAPRRLLRDPPGVFRTPLRIKSPVALLRGGAVEAIPLASWRGGNLYVTAVKLRNLTSAPVILDPRDLRGPWLAATFQHARLLPRGDEADSTCVYLISARPFAESL